MKKFLSSIFILLILIFSQISNATIVGMITGDSFSNDRGDWPAFVTDATLFSTAIGGQQLVQMPNNFRANLDAHIQNSGVNAAIIQGGVNDISANSINLEMMQGAVIDMVDAAVQRDLDVFIFNIAPWNAATSQAKQDEIEDYNAWLERYTDQEGINLIDMYAAVVDANNPQNTRPEFDRDGIHLNRDGAIAVAAIFNSAVSEVPLPAAMWLFVTGLLGVVSFNYKRKVYTTT